MGRFFSILLSAISLWLSAASAQTPSHVMLETLMATSIFAPPPWNTEGPLEAHSEVVVQQGRAANGNDFFRWHSVPKGEDFERWSRLYSVKAEHPLKGDIGRYADGEISEATKDCEDPAVQFAKTATDRTLLFVVYCPESRLRPYTGRLAFYNLTKVEDLLVQNVLTLKVPSFSLDTELSEETRARILSALRYVAALQVVY